MEAVAEATDVQTGEMGAVDSLGGKYLTFTLGNETYGVDILKVREIIGIMDITHVPQTSAFVEGVIHLRGKVIPVVDLRMKFRLEPRRHDQQTCIIVVDVGELMGIIVDCVQQVDDIPSEDVEPPPSLGSATDTRLILGMGKVGDDVKMLLDIDRVLTTEELVEALEAAG